MLNSNALVDVSTATAFLQLNNLDNAPLVERLINSISSQFETKTGRKFVPTTLTDYRVSCGCGTSGNLYGAGWYRGGRSFHRHLFLPFIPVQSVSKIDMRYEWDDSVYKVITDPSAFVLKNGRTGHLILKDDYFLCGTDNLLITMDVGFLDVRDDPDSLDTPPAQLPADPELEYVRDLCLIQLAANYKKWQANDFGVTARTFDNVSVAFVPEQELLLQVKQGLESLRSYTYF